MKNQQDTYSIPGTNNSSISKEDAFQLILDNASESYLLVDTNLRVIYTNEYTRKLFLEHMRTAVTAGTCILDLVKAERREALAALYSDVFRGNEKSTLVEIPKNEDVAYFEVSFRPARNTAGEIVGALITSRDITQKKKAEKIIEEFEERWRFALEGTNHGVWDWNMKTNQIFFSESYRRLYGFDANDILDRYDEWMNRVHPDDIGILEAAIEKHKTSKDPYHETLYRIRDKAGNYRWILGRGKIVLRDEDGTPLRMIGMHTDITNQKREADNYKLLFYDSPTPMWTCDLNSLCFLDVNNAALELYGYTKEQFKSLTLPDLFVDRSIEAAFKTFLIHRSSQKISTTSQHTTKDGQQLYVQLTANLLEKENVTIVLGLCTDITHRIKSEEALRKSNERFLLASRATSDALYDWDLTTNHIYWSDSLSTLFGHEPEGFSIDSWEKLLHPHDREVVKQSLDRALNGNDALWESEYRLMKADGTFGYVIERGFIVRGTDNRPVRMIGSLQDYTKRKYNKQLLSLERSVFERAVNHVEEFAKTVSTLLAGIEELHPDLFSSLLLLNADGPKSSFIAPRLDSSFKEVMEMAYSGPLNGAFGAAVNSREIAIAEDIDVNPQWDKLSDLIRHYQLKACWSFPLASGDSFVLGTFATYCKHARHPNPLELQTLNRVRNILTILIEQNRALQEIKQMNERFDNIMTATNDLIWDMNVETGRFYRSQVGLEKVYGIGSNAIVETMQQFLMRIHPADRNRVEKEFSLLSRSQSETSFEIEYRFKRDDGGYNFVYDRGMLIRTDKNRPWRMVGAAQNVTERKRLEKEVLTNELQKQKAINQATIDTQEKERTEIGRELHDNVNQVLTTTKLYLELAMSKHEMKDELIEKSSKNIISVINEIRQLSRSLMDANIEDLGLVDSVNDLLSNINLTGKLNVFLFADKKIELALTKNQQLTVYRIIQEVLNNAVKHSQATDVEIFFRNDNNLMEISIHDNGIGFELPLIKKGSGLKNIENRVYLLNGTLSLQAKPGAGCNFVIKFPVA